ncbi:hypothetical protein [Rhizobium sp. MHM7A]|uniref:hypothetical protein n=1 Tax=Rhizobium sp. MHM7A TaxID=2583233 RepID=UPI0011072047|nr:hypothetical protein [Rhizobium sp. MHM7A]TLX15968.1 hypothetical protein FFR93_01235 [Rhizobium sp. MHM7A]
MTTNAALPTTHPSRLTHFLISSFKRKAYSAVLQELHDNKPSRAITRDPNSLVEAWKSMLDAAQRTRDGLNEADRPLLYALLHTGLAMDYVSFLRSNEEFAEGISTVRETSLYRQEQELLFDALWDHPFAKSMREEFMLLDRATALDKVKTAWDEGDIKAFLYIVNALTSIQNHQHRRTDPRFSEGTFSDAIASHPGLELIVIPVQRGNGVDSGDTQAPLPPLRLIVSNKPLPVEYAQEPTEEDVTGFVLASAAGTYSSLKRYMVDALSDRNESIGHGPYYYTSNDDRGLAPASNVVSAIHHYLATPTNFAFNAQERMKEQLEAIRNVAVGPTYAHRYLRADKQVDWSEALNFANGLSKELKTLDPRAASEVLVTHGMSYAVENLLKLRFKDEAAVEEVRTGYLQGISILHADMVELIHAEGGSTEALERFERYRGFHPDVLMFPVEERLRLAFQDISDMMTAHLTGLTILEELFDEERPLASKIDFANIVRTMIVAGDITNAMRVYESLGVQRNPNIADAISQTFKDLGYHVFPEFKVTKLDGLAGRALLDSHGNLYSKLVKAPHYQSVDQITAGTDLLSASLAYYVLTSLKFRDDVGERPAQQIAALKDFIAQRSLVKELKENMQDLPDPLKPLYLDGVKLEADDLADNLALKGVRNPQEAVKQAISEVSGNKPRAAFHRIMKALGNVSELMSNKSKK